MSEDLRHAIRTILLEELAARGVKVDTSPSPSDREEVVTIQSDQELADFVKRLLAMTKNSGLRADLEAGRYRFRLASATLRPSALPTPRAAIAAGKVVRFDSGLITEKHINSLPDDVTVVQAGTSVKFTPLAMDAARQGGIKVERQKS